MARQCQSTGLRGGVQAEHLVAVRVAQRCSMALARQLAAISHRSPANNVQHLVHESAARQQQRQFDRGGELYIQGSSSSLRASAAPVDIINHTCRVYLDDAL